MKILAIESSFDETAAAVIEDGTTVLSSVISTSSKLHEEFGGTLPELAAREQLKYIIPVLSQTLNQAFPQLSPPVGGLNSQLSALDAIAVSVGPGLIGSLLIGVETAKTISMITKKPIIPVNHVLAHIYGCFVHRPSLIEKRKHDDPNNDNRLTIHDTPIRFPAISLVVSGGHTELFFMESEKHLKWIGGTIDDAAGEAFDKTARLLGFANRGGVAIQEAARKIVHRKSLIVHRLPRPMMHDDTLNFSFSGLKTAVLREWNKLQNDSRSTINEITINELAYEIQEAITDVLVTKTLRAAEQYNAASILVSGGVAANLRLREKFQQETINDKRQTMTSFPPIEWCTDNAVTIGSYAYFRGQPTDWHDITATPDLTVEIKQ